MNISEIKKITIESQRKKMYLLTCASNKLSNQPAHLRSVISVFVVRMKNSASMAIQNMTSEDSDQTARMRSLIRIFAGHTCPKLSFLTLRVNLPSTNNIRAV